VAGPGDRGPPKRTVFCVSFGMSLKDDRNVTSISNWFLLRSGSSDSLMSARAHLREHLP
jgi:hypothetical protein